MKKVGIISLLLLFLLSCAVETAPQRNIKEKVISLVGSKYRYGGESPRTGFDCSGLVYYVYRSSGYKIPRSTERQLKAGKTIKRGFEKGDLLFFKFNGKLHVGIFIGKHHMVHASPERGVVVENLNRYWKKHFCKGVRII